MNNPLNKYFHSLLLITSTLLLLSSCGFKFRGQVTSDLKSVQINLIADDSFGLLTVELKRQLQSLGANLNVTKVKGDFKIVTVYLGAPKETRNTLSVDKNGRPVEYEFVMDVPINIQPYHETEEKISVPDQLHIRRVLVYDNNLLLAKSSERDQVRAEMRRVLVSQIIERIRAYASKNS